MALLPVKYCGEYIRAPTPSMPIACASGGYAHFNMYTFHY